MAAGCTGWHEPAMERAVLERADGPDRGGEHGYKAGSDDEGRADEWEAHHEHGHGRLQKEGPFSGSLTG